MKRLFYFLMTLSVVLLIASCATTPENDEFSYVEETVNKKSDLEKFNRQMKLMKNIRFETDTFVFDMTLDEVRALGFPDSMYEYMQHKMKKKTDEARAIIAQGGRFDFINTLCENNVESGMFTDYSNGNMINNIRGRGLVYWLYGELHYPGVNTASFEIPAEHAYTYKGYLFSFISPCYNYKTGEEIMRSVWYTFSVTGKDRDGVTVKDGMTVIGSGYRSTSWLFPFQGDVSADGTRSQTLGFSAEVEMVEKTDRIKLARMAWSLSEAV